MKYKVSRNRTIVYICICRLTFMPSPSIVWWYRIEEETMRRTAVLSVAVMIVAALVLAGCGPQEEDTIKIGVAGAHSGDLASYGLPTVNAAQLVVNEINENGGIDGRMVELIIEDDQCAPEVAANTAAKLVSDGVVAVIGHICSGATNTALPIYQEEGIVTISPSATNPTLTEYEIFFRTIAPDDAQSALQVDYVVDELGVSRVAVLHDRGDYGQGLADFAVEYLEAEDIEIVLYDGVTVGAVDYSAIINRIAAEEAEIVIWGGYHPEASKLVDQMRSRGMDIMFIGGDGIMDETFINVAGEAAEGVYATSAKSTEGNTLAAEYVARHVEEYGSEPGPFFQEGVSATIALLNAIDAADSTESDAIMAALKTEYVDTPVGNISFDDAGDAIGVGFAVYQVQNQEYVEVSN
jgi:branched-chain amino acid transport system substrate-binding protein